jgi:hypothetical protein
MTDQQPTSRALTAHAPADKSCGCGPDCNCGPDCRCGEQGSCNPACTCGDD